ncbi:two-component system sensor histidine kinase NtrB [Dethiobacter alkaliphilus]|uniref:two-component system sensor histidine kinase NtrB n=1 Tax=Dethiobacter alkaliphilus TaxID=427926 RepID=UPI00222666B9|nr:ATP-binding protein [Dethiobacter alkaliphilus]MCW3489329.1 ATP-binding protein [Dethiobacter alkaliphilus]
MQPRTLAEKFFSERSFSLSLKLTVFIIALLSYAMLYITFSGGYLSTQEWRLILYFLYMIIFAATFLCGFMPGIVIAVLSSILASSILVPQGLTLEQLSVADLEIYPFVAMYFIIVITVNWFRENIERLKEQLVENERLHQQARHMEKLMLAGEIAAGIAHEVRNPLTVVQGYIQLISAKCKKQCNSEQSFSLLLDELKRANDIISDFLRFSRPDQPQKNQVNPNEVIESSASLIYGEAMRHNVRIFLYPDANMPTVLLDKDQLIQVFLNLFHNAIQAMPQGGTITVYTGYDKHLDLVTIKVIDSGTGMDAQTAQRLFSPFYTTKENGTGLGLSISQSIIHAHGGEIKVESTPGQGTEFFITLPLHNLTEQHSGGTL